MLRSWKLSAVTIEVTELNNRKDIYIKDAGYFQRVDDHETRIANREKVKKNHRFKHKWKMIFVFNFLSLSEEVGMLGKNVGESSHTWRLKEKI